MWFIKTMWLLFVSRNMNCFCWPARASAAHVPGVSGRSATLRSLFANNKVIDGVPTHVHQAKVGYSMIFVR